MWYDGMTPQLSFAPMRADTMISRWPRDVGIRNCIFYWRFHVCYLCYKHPESAEINLIYDHLIRCRNERYQSTRSQKHLLKLNPYRFLKTCTEQERAGGTDRDRTWIANVCTTQSQICKLPNGQMAMKPLGILANLQKSLKNLTQFSSLLMSFVCFQKFQLQVQVPS